MEKWEESSIFANKKKRMILKKIPTRLIKDYFLISIAYISLIMILHPVYFGEFRITEIKMNYSLIQLGLLLFVLIAGELFVTYVLRKPFSYSDDMASRLYHFVYCTIFCIPLLTSIMNQLYVLNRFGIEHWNYAWVYFDGSFTLKWFIRTLPFCAVTSLVVQVVGMTILSEIRLMRESIVELVSINHLLEAEQKTLRSRLPKDNVTDKVILHGDSRESLIVNPLDIMYVESVGNYLNIVYFNDSDLCQKRLRSSLKEIEETLEAFPFMVHTHRAFLVNINFITQVSGNSAGYKISMFSTDRILPVSKVNVAMFREKIKELGKVLR